MLSELILRINNLILLYKEIYLYSSLKIYRKETTIKLKILYEKYQKIIYEITKELNNLNVGVLSKKDKKLIEYNYYIFQKYINKFPLENTEFFTEINKLNDKLKKYWDNYFIENNLTDFSNNKLKKIIFCTKLKNICPFFHVLFLGIFIFLIILEYFFPDKTKDFQEFCEFLLASDIIFLTFSVFISFAEEELNKKFLFFYFKYIKKILKS